MSTSCQTDGNYTAIDGLNFTTYCGEDISASAYSSKAPTSQTNLTQCIDTCAREPYLCYGIVYQSSNSSCWELTNSTASKESNLDTATNLDTALSNQSQLVIANVSCPYTNDSMQSTSTDVDFLVHCNTQVSGSEICPWNQDLCREHVDSLEECMDLCVQAHPLCKAASWNPGMIGGYQNCYLYDDGTTTGETVNYILHSVILDLPDIATGCPTDKSYTSTAGTSNSSFTVSCNQKATSATNLTFTHENNITACMDSCASYTGTSDCEAIIFDPSMGIGYENCQLLNSVDLVGSASGINYASIASSNSSSPADSSSSSSGSSSKAWIAGPVIGGLVAIAAIGAGVWWWKRRKANAGTTAAAAAAAAAPANTQSSGEYKPVYPPGYAEAEGQSTHPTQEVPKTQPPVEQQPTEFHELPTQTVHELDN